MAILSLSSHPSHYIICIVTFTAVVFHPHTGSIRIVNTTHVLLLVVPEMYRFGGVKLASCEVQQKTQYHQPTAEHYDRLDISLVRIFLRMFSTKNSFSPPRVALGHELWRLIGECIQETPMSTNDAELFCNINIFPDMEGSEPKF